MALVASRAGSLQTKTTYLAWGCKPPVKVRESRTLESPTSARFGKPRDFNPCGAVTMRFGTSSYGLLDTRHGVRGVDVQ